MSRARLFESDRLVGPRSKCRELVPLERARCHRCGSPISEARIAEPALFRHGGYGAVRETIFEVCADDECRTVRQARVVETNPRWL